jgi:hypothetical protein
VHLLGSIGLSHGLFFGKRQPTILTPSFPPFFITSRFSPSLIQRAAGFDMLDFLSVGPRDVLVPGALVEEAKQVLKDTTRLGFAGGDSHVNAL